MFVLLKNNISKIETLQQNTINVSIKKQKIPRTNLGTLFFLILRKAQTTIHICVRNLTKKQRGVCLRPLLLFFLLDGQASMNSTQIKKH